MGTSQPGSGHGALITGAAYLLLFVLGGLEGMIGSFFYSNNPVPLVAAGFAVLIFATCLLAGWGMQTRGAGIIAAIGWILASFILAMPRPNGSVIITATSAGEWYLYGGALAACVGAVIALFAWGGPRARARLSRPPGRVAG
jgi:hypothetical protein